MTRIIIINVRGTAQNEGQRLNEKTSARRLGASKSKWSHHVLQKGNKTEVVPIHGKDVPKGLLEKILKRTGLK